MPDDGDHLKMVTEADLATQVDRVIALFRKAGIRELADHVDRINRTAGRLGLSRMRVPCGLAESERNTPVACRTVGAMVSLRKIHPDVECTLDAIVLPPDVARSYELASLMVGNMGQSVNSDAIPLETFSIEFLRESDRIYSVQQWKTEVCSPGMALYPIVRALVNNPPPFRGIAWLKVMPWS